MKRYREADERVAKARIGETMADQQFASSFVGGSTVMKVYNAEPEESK